MTTATNRPLTDTDFAALERESWIDRATAQTFGLYRVTSVEGAELVGRTDHEDYSGIVFPTYWPGDPAPKEFFLRRDHPPLEQSSNGTPKATRRYLAPPGRGNRLLSGPGESAAALNDATVPIVMVEGHKKLLAAYRLARHNQEVPFLACGLTGVWNFRGTIGKATDASGARISIKGIIPDFERIIWPGRIVVIVYDSDALTNPKVMAAREALAEELRTRGACVAVMFTPALDGLEKTGFDDLLARWGPEQVEAWLHAGQMGAAEAVDPDPIILDARTVPNFPTSLIPVPWLRDMIEATATATETPVELALMLSLSVVATTVQTKYDAEPEPGYREPLNLWTSPALESGNRKTSVVKEMTAPLIDYERRQAAQIAPAMIRAASARQLAEDQVKALRARAVKASGVDLECLREELFQAESSLPVVPIPVRLWCQDITPEKLGQMMAEHGERMAILSDEGGLFDILAGRYSQGVPNLDLFLQAHAGMPYRVDRGSRPSIMMNAPALTLALSPQPSVLKGLAKIPGFRGRGFLARFLYALPTSTLGARTLDTSPVSPDVRSAYHVAIHALLDLPTRDDGHPYPLPFSPEAHQEWKAFQRHVEVELRDGAMFEHVRDWASKLPGACARIAGVLHCAEYADAAPQAHPISLQTMDAALGFGALLERHALAVFGLMSVDSDLDVAQKVWAWVQHQRQATFSKRDCFHALQGTFHDMGGIQPAFEILIERGYLFPLPLTLKVGRPSPRYRVNQCFLKEWES